ncbi:MAG: hypothetical protein V2I24_01395, partial [Halieaceae bacterium]|nr:hypothetical protein [Halieaceae bacterium]
ALRHLPRSHHRQTSLASTEVNQRPRRRSSGVFQHNPDKAAIWMPQQQGKRSFRPRLRSNVPVYGKFSFRFGLKSLMGLIHD